MHISNNPSNFTASLVGVAALGVAASKIDNEFDEFISDAMYKKSDVLGAGYENVLKAEGGVKGTAKKTAAKTQKKGLF